MKGSMKAKILTGFLLGLVLMWGCSSLEVGRDVQAGRNALQTGRPQDAVGYLARASAQDPNYVLPFQLGENVLTYLGRAYYETGRDQEARATLEKALARNSNDHVARLYLGLTLLRSGDKARGEKEIQSGLKGINDAIDALAAHSLFGQYWDPGRQIRGDIQRAMALRSDSPELVALAERIGKTTDEEEGRVRRDENRTLYGRAGDS